MEGRNPQILLSDPVIGESPRWHDDRLWFCHWGTDEIVAVDLDGKAEVGLHDREVGPHSIDRLPDGRMLIVAKNRPGLLLRQKADGSIVTHADLRVRHRGPRQPDEPPGVDTFLVMAAVWNHLDPWGGPRTGQVLAVQAPAAGAGRPGTPARR